MRNIDTSIFSAEKPTRIKPDEIDLSGLPPIQKPAPLPSVAQEVVFAPQPSATEEKNPQTDRKTVRKYARTEKRTQNRPENRSVLPIKRKTKRYSFEFYDDQLTRLKRIKNRVEMDGGTIALSDIVRQALDNYLEEQGE